jgi:hypothetical protein
VRAIYISMRWWCLLCTRPRWPSTSLHLDTLSWFCANQSLFLLLNGAKAANTNITILGLIWRRLEPTIDCTQGKHANHYITYADSIICDERNYQINNSMTICKEMTSIMMQGRWFKNYNYILPSIAVELSVLGKPCKLLLVYLT